MMGGLFLDSYELLDADGNIVATKPVVHHLRMVINDNGGIKPREVYTVRSVKTGLTLKVTSKTPSAAWHEFDRECAMLID
ncbi:hypothetical protein [Anaerovibrio sp. RM50]|uniref:hypothetical protein n=1 Tax=Anaerovibrio sp. RM50 TaxID=1200557 RepID=UPI00047F298D|nr:hypothetical protein [Anaerovibrio sp. RM50]